MYILQADACLPKLFMSACQRNSLIYIYIYVYRNVTQVHASGNRSWVHDSETAYT